MLRLRNNHQVERSRREDLREEYPRPHKPNTGFQPEQPGFRG